MTIKEFVDLLVEIGSRKTNKDELMGPNAASSSHSGSHSRLRLFSISINPASKEFRAFIVDAYENFVHQIKDCDFKTYGDMVSIFEKNIYSKTGKNKGNIGICRLLIGKIKQSIIDEEYFGICIMRHDSPYVGDSDDEHDKHNEHDEHDEHDNYDDFVLINASPQ